MSNNLPSWMMSPREITADGSEIDFRPPIIVDTIPDPYKKKQAPKPKEDEEDYDLSRSLAVLGKTAASVAGGGVPDTFSALYNIPAAAYEYFSGNTPPYIPSQTQMYSEAWDDLTKGYTKTPKKGILANLASGVDTGASLIVPSIGAKKLAQKGFTKAGKTLGFFGASAPIDYAAATAGGAALKAYEAEGVPQSFLMSLLASAATKKGVKIGAEKSNLLKKFSGVSGQKPTYNERLLTSFSGAGSTPDPEILAQIERQGIRLTPKTMLNSNNASWIENSVLDTPFASKKYKEMASAPYQDVKTAVQKVGDELLPQSFVGAEEGLDELAYKKILQAGKEKTDMKNALYAEAQNSNPNAKVELLTALPYAREIVEKLSKRSKKSLSDGEKVALAQAEGFVESFGQNLSKEDISILNFKPKNLVQEWGDDATKFQTGKLSDTMATRKSLNETMQAKRKSIGEIPELIELKKRLDFDVDLSPDQKTSKLWQGAIEYYRDHAAPVIKDDFFKALKNKNFDKEFSTLEKLNSQESFRKLERFLYDVEGGKEIFDSLKKFKFEQITGEILGNSDGKTSFAKLYNLLAGKSKDSPLLKELVGEKSYEDLNQLSKVVSKINSSGKEHKNFSGTGKTLVAVAQAGTATNVLWNALTGDLDKSDIVKTGAIMSPYVLSRVLSNPRYIKEVKDFAIAKSKDDKFGMKYASSIIKDIIKDVTKSQAPMVRKKSFKE